VAGWQSDRERGQIEGEAAHAGPPVRGSAHDRPFHGGFGCSFDEAAAWFDMSGVFAAEAARSLTVTVPRYMNAIASPAPTTATVRPSPTIALRQFAKVLSMTSLPVSPRRHIAGIAWQTT